jgi:hypothetical protein
MWGMQNTKRMMAAAKGYWDNQLRLKIDLGVADF